MNAAERERLSLLGRIYRAQAAEVELEAERRRRQAAEDAILAQRAEIAAGQQRAQEARSELARVQESATFRLGAALVAAMRSPRQLLRLPRTLAGLLRANRAAARAGAPAPQSTGPEFSPLPSMPVPAPEARAVELRQVSPPPPPPAALSELRIAAVLDPFSVASFAPECRLLELSPDDWHRQLETFRPHLLLVESAWLGRDGEWRGLVERGGDTLRSLVESCRRAGLPTAFWNKEDPLHFEAFFESAKLFDHVFTTDAGCLPRYRAELGHDRVHLLPFALQPRTHHPVAAAKRADAAFFAGAWYGHMDQRSADFHAVAGAVGLAMPLDIYDRNSGSGDPQRRYPSRYADRVRPSVPFEDTPDLYRAYRVGLNLNTVKTSPTMFARRVFELIGCNTSVYGNHSRGVRLLLGDLTVSTDDGEALLAAAYAEACAPDALRYRRRRLLALRKVLEQHTWRHRVQQVAAKVLGAVPDHGGGPIVMFARVDDEAGLQQVVTSWRRQRGVVAALAVQVPASLRPKLPDGVVDLGDAGAMRPEERFPGAWLAPVAVADHYGPDYLRDLALGRDYTDGDVLGKAAFHRLDGGALRLVDGESEYRRVPSLALRRSLLPARRWAGTLAELLEAIDDASLTGDDLVSLDVFSYAADAAGSPVAEPAADEPDPDAGVEMDAISAASDRLQASPPLAAAGTDAIDGRVLARIFNCGVIPANVSAAPRRGRLELCSLLPAGSEDALFSMPIERAAFERDGDVVVTLAAATDGDGVDFYLDALDAAGNAIARVGLPSQTPARLPPPPATAGYRLAVGVRGRQLRHIDGLWLGEGAAEPLLLPGDGRLLVVVNGYPRAGDLYRNAFVHQRVLAYRRRGIDVDVVVVASGQAGVDSWDFEGVSVLSCGPATLKATLAISGHAAIAVHFLDSRLWPAIADAARTIRTVVWLHGAEVQPWARRAFNVRTEEERTAAVAASDERMAFWRGLLAAPPAELRLAFVSKASAEDAWEDLGLRWPESHWRVIHNPIDDALFEFVPKPASQRFKVLSIRPHASRIYANDLVAAAIRALADEPVFPRLQFHLVGDGPLFDENFAGLEQFPNVRIERRFLRRTEIAAVHREHGVFLVPTRGDTQGVSRDEAMASGLVPVTNDVGAVAEFVDATCAVLAPAEDVAALAAGIVAIVEDADRFAAMSAAAAARVRRQSGIGPIVDRELDWLGVKTSADPGNRFPQRDSGRPSPYTAALPKHRPR